MSKFSVMWSNNSTYTRKGMSKQRVTLRDALGEASASLGGLNGKALHLDQVHIWFRPTATIGALEFVAGDANTKNWRVETYQLLVRLIPGERFTLYCVESGTDGGDYQTSRNPERTLTYSAALTESPDVEGTEDYWCRTFRPVRDIPVCKNLDGVSEMSIELLFPLLYQSSSLNNTIPPLTQVPDYRILRVLCEFSLDHC